MSDAISRLQTANVTGFNVISPVLIYIASLVWLGALAGVKGAMMVMNEWKMIAHLEPLLWTLIGLNAWTAIFQFIDVRMFDFKNWFIISMHWVSQLASISLTAGLVPLSISVGGDHNLMRLYIALPLVVAEAMYTASQFSVTLEYIHRSVHMNATSIKLSEQANELPIVVEQKKKPSLSGKSRNDMRAS